MENTNLKIIEILKATKNCSMDQFGLALAVIRNTTMNIQDGYMAIRAARLDGIVEWDNLSSITTTVKLSQKYWQ